MSDIFAFSIKFKILFSKSRILNFRFIQYPDSVSELGHGISGKIGYVGKPLRQLCIIRVDYIFGTQASGGKKGVKSGSYLYYKCLRFSILQLKNNQNSPQYTNNLQITSGYFASFGKLNTFLRNFPSFYRLML